MQYKGQLAPLAPEVIKVSLARQTNADVAEFIRRNFINAMRNGETLRYDIESLSPDFAAYTVEGTFVAEKFFDWNFMNERDNYMPYVREEENHGIGGINPGIGYIRSDNFVMVIRGSADDEEHLNQQISKIPNFYTHFHHVIIQ